MNPSKVEVEIDYEEPDDPMVGLWHRLIIVIAATFSVLILLLVLYCFYKKQCEQDGE